jgi:hypothetical protein
MSNIPFFNKRTYNRYSHLCYQKKMIEQEYDFFICTIKNNVLICSGWLQPDGCKNKYKIKIEYVAGFEPKSTILSPKIEPCKEIHMYNDHSICLHYPEDMKWSEQIKITNYTIPWISEWIIFYELFLINRGNWKGRESPTHIHQDEKNINKEPY